MYISWIKSRNIQLIIVASVGPIIHLIELRKRDSIIFSNYEIKNKQGF
jgi:hypothetical protein